MSSPARYVRVWAALALLTAATLFLSRQHLGPFALPVALAIASAKSALVVLFFMHLAEHRGASPVVLAVAVVFVVVLILFAVVDVQTRFPLAAPYVEPPASLPPQRATH